VYDDSGRRDGVEKRSDGFRHAAGRWGLRRCDLPGRLRLGRRRARRRVHQHGAGADVGQFIGGQVSVGDGNDLLRHRTGARTALQVEMPVVQLRNRAFSENEDEYVAGWVRLRKIAHQRWFLPKL